MTLENRIQSFVQLGHVLRAIPVDTFDRLAEQAYKQNQWFTPNSIRKALDGMIRYLDETALRHWLSGYQIDTPSRPQKIGVVMAGNLPAVGFHDLLCVLLSGHNLQVKLSSDDAVVLPFIIDQLIAINPEFTAYIAITDTLRQAEAYIATGSNNTARYFEYYFKNKAHIIRRNRNGIAILNGKENKEDIKHLGEDIFTYFGLGCRNVSKLYLPKDYDLVYLLDHLPENKEVISHHKYINNYTYNNALFALKQMQYLDNGFLLITENELIASPIAVLHYEYYQDSAHLTKMLEEKKDHIQCTVSKAQWVAGSFDLGEAQKPRLEDYADGVDTLAFLSGLSS